MAGIFLFVFRPYGTLNAFSLVLLPTFGPYGTEEKYSKILRDDMLVMQIPNGGLSPVGTKYW